MTPERLAEIREVERAALPGPWTVCVSNAGYDSHFGVRVAILPPGHYLHPAVISLHWCGFAAEHEAALSFSLGRVWYDEEDNCLNPEARKDFAAACAFVALARDAIPELVAEVERLQEQVRSIAAMVVGLFNVFSIQVDTQQEPENEL